MFQDNVNLNVEGMSARMRGAVKRETGETGEATEETGVEVTIGDTDNGNKG